MPIFCIDPPSRYGDLEGLWRFLTEEAPRMPQDEPAVQQATKEASEALKRQSN